MQTFLPLPDYYESMKCLDKSRLGNQVWREGLTLIRGGWTNHPASKMWRGHEYHLGLYLLAGVDVLRERKEKESKESKLNIIYSTLTDSNLSEVKTYEDLELKIKNEMKLHKNTGNPIWFGDEQFHASHRSNLLRKAKEALIKSESETNVKKQQKYLDVYNWYMAFGWTEPDDLPYVWPIKKNKIK